MHAKIKMILGIAIFVAVIGGSAVAYNLLSQKVTPEQVEAEPTSDEPTKATDFEVIDTAGKKVKLSDFKGKPVVVNFWASWCPPCQRELPAFDTLSKEYEGKVQFMMVDVTDGQRETIESGKAHIKEAGFTFPLFFDYQLQGANGYAVQALPTTLFVDKEGNISYRQTGEINEPTLKSRIQSLL